MTFRVIKIRAKDAANAGNATEGIVVLKESGYTFKEPQLIELEIYRRDGKPDGEWTLGYNGVPLELQQVFDLSPVNPKVDDSAQ